MSEQTTNESSEKKSLNFIEQIVVNDLAEGKKTTSIMKKTIIFMWNPYFSSYKMEQFEDELHHLHIGNYLRFGTCKIRYIVE